MKLIKQWKVGIRQTCRNKTNKQFKSDSARLALLVWVKFSVYGGQIECRGCVLHTLIGRYVFLTKRSRQ
ncbi:hypothetical protein BSR23_008270 [Vibrio parahaemolyticus]|nr:hypothetical protein BSR23_008270 [Vibrio parahaemolyticus]